MSAWINGFIGVFATFMIGTYRLEMTASEIVQCIVASLISGLIAPILILKAEKTPWIRKYVLTRSLKTWAFFVGIYFGVLLALAPSLREVECLTWLAMPLIMSTGFSILVFGPIQDRLVARAQRRSRAA